MKRMLAASLILSALFQPLAALAQQAPQEYWPGPWHMWGGGWGFWWMFPVMMLFFVAACFAIFAFGHRFGGGGSHRSSALQILDERFARGEIQKAEYEEKKTTLLSRGSS